VTRGGFGKQPGATDMRNGRSRGIMSGKMDTVRANRAPFKDGEATGFTVLFLWLFNYSRGKGGETMARQFRIYYAKSPVFLPNPGLRRSNLGNTHVWLVDLEAENLDDVFDKMQGEVWSPNGEAKDLISTRGLRHTSMSVGDVIHDVKADRYFESDMIGFREIP